MRGEKAGVSGMVVFGRFMRESSQIGLPTPVLLHEPGE